MRNRWVLHLILFVAVALIATVCHGADTTIATTFLSIHSERFPQVFLQARVVPPPGVLLGNARFEVFENDVRVASCSMRPELPVGWNVLLLDRSARTGMGMPDLIRAASEIVASLPADAFIQIVTFGGKPVVSHPFSQDRASLKNCLAGLQASGAATLSEGILSACAEFRGKRGDDEIRTIILLTNGVFEGDASVFDKAVETAVKASVRILVVGFGDKVDDQKMKILAQKTRGGFMKIPTAQGLSEICGKIVKRIRAETYLFCHYTTPDPRRDGTTRAVRLAGSVNGVAGQGVTSYVAPSNPSASSATIATDTADSAAPPATGDGTTAAGTDGAATGDGPAPGVSIPTPRVNVHEIKDKLNQQTGGDDGLGEGE